MKTNKNNTEPKNESYNSDITEDDIQAIGKKGLRADSEDDRMLLEREEDIDFKGEDLDVPGRKNTEPTSKEGLKDEENSLYGQGGENKDNLEAPERANMDKS